MFSIYHFLIYSISNVFGYLTIPGVMYITLHLCKNMFHIVYSDMQQVLYTILYCPFYYCHQDDDDSFDDEDDTEERDYVGDEAVAESEALVSTISTVLYVYMFVGDTVAWYSSLYFPKCDSFAFENWIFVTLHYTSNKTSPTP